MRATLSIDLRFFWVSCEEIFTTVAQRGCVATKAGIVISPKGPTRQSRTRVGIYPAKAQRREEKRGYTTEAQRSENSG